MESRLLTFEIGTYMKWKEFFNSYHRSIHTLAITLSSLHFFEYIIIDYYQSIHWKNFYDTLYNEWVERLSRLRMCKLHLNRFFPLGVFLKFNNMEMNSWAFQGWKMPATGVHCFFLLFLKIVDSRYLCNLTFQNLSVERTWNSRNLDVPIIVKNTKLIIA